MTCLKRGFYAQRTWRHLDPANLCNCEQTQDKGHGVHLSPLQ
jgi:hypothetical protein